tara:strand:+ start:2629 stop:2892 length:264 start_codon:yes stop_codon:yes gene_type:complete
MSSATKDRTSTNEQAYASLRKMYTKTSSKKDDTFNGTPVFTKTFQDNSSYVRNKASIQVGNSNVSSMFTLDNKREIIQSKRRIRSSG